MKAGQSECACGASTRRRAGSPGARWPSSSPADLAFGKTVTVRVRDIDRYKRTVAEIILPDGRNLNQELVRAGMAWWYRQFAKRDTVLPELERKARAAKRGLWADPLPVPPGEWRKAAR